MSEQEELMDNLLNVDLEIIDIVRALQQENWNSESLQNQVTDLLKIRDEMVVKLMSLKGNDNSCDCGHDHN
jgi:hypothetical protein